MPWTTTNISIKEILLEVTQTQTHWAADASWCVCVLLRERSLPLYDGLLRYYKKYVKFRPNTISNILQTLPSCTKECETFQWHLTPEFVLSFASRNPSNALPGIKRRCVSQHELKFKKSVSIENIWWLMCFKFHYNSDFLFVNFNFKHNMGNPVRWSCFYQHFVG